MEGKGSKKVVVLGCPKNRVDTEWGLSLINKGVYFINTCAFIKPAVQESFEEIERGINEVEKGKYKEVWVVGCLVERFGKDYLKNRYKKIDFIKGIDWYIDKKNYHLSRHPLKSYAYLKISDGCDNRCFYCTIPYIKGKYRSRFKEKIVEEAIFLEKKGIKEIVIIANDVTQYGRDLYKDEGSPFIDLLSELVKIDNVRYRFLYLYPSKVDFELIQFIVEHENIFNYVDIPFQHVSDKVLKEMGRKYTKKEIVSIVQQLKKNNIQFRTTFITGYPVEEEEDFEQILDFIEKYRPFNVGVFRYFHENLAPSFSMYEDIVPAPIKEQRKEKITELFYTIKEETLKNLKEIEVIIDEVDEEGFFYGRTIYDAPEIDDTYIIRGKDLKIGKTYMGSIGDSLSIFID